MKELLHTNLNHTTTLQEVLCLASQPMSGHAHMAAIDDTVSKSGGVSVFVLRSAQVQL